MLGLRWALDECAPFMYFLKTDDDMIVNFDVLISQLERLPALQTKGKLALCDLCLHIWVKKCISKYHAIYWILI